MPCHNSLASSVVATALKLLSRYQEAAGLGIATKRTGGRKGIVSNEGRARMAAAQRSRWAAVKKAEGKGKLDMPHRPRIVLLGCVHQAQEQPDARSFWNEHCIAMARLVEEIVTNSKIQFIGEEAKHQIITNAAIVANQHNIPCKSLDIPQAIQDGIKQHPRSGIDPKTRRPVKFEGRIVMFLHGILCGNTTCTKHSLRFGVSAIRHY
jgi:hypothetical protein